MSISPFDFKKIKQDALDEAAARYGCNHPKDRLTKVVCSNGAIQYKRQCIYCFQATTTPISHRLLSQEEKLNAPPFDRVSQERVRKQFYELSRKMANDAFWANYPDYLRTDYWLDKSAAVIARYDGECQYHYAGCLQRATQAHHLTYSHVGEEPLEDLVAVCKNCHEIITAESRRMWASVWK